MSLKVGDKVRFLNETGGGEVVEVISAFKVKVRTEDGFDYVYPVNELVPDTPPEEYDRVPRSDKDVKPTVHIPQKWQKAHLEIDLHIHNLMDDTRNLTNFEMIQIQLDAVRSIMEEARNKKVKKVIIIHGVGQGVLKTEVLKLLETYANIEVEDASFRKYGFGATEVSIRYN